MMAAKWYEDNTAAAVEEEANAESDEVKPISNTDETAADNAVEPVKANAGAEKIGEIEM